jgi:hypothetical protein
MTTNGRDDVDGAQTYLAGPRLGPPGVPSGPVPPPAHHDVLYRKT